MPINDRTKKILDYLKETKSASVEELASMLYVSGATIRRDLNKMQKLGQIERSHGGAILMENADEISIFIRQTKNAREKENVASIALKHLPPFKTVFIDNSSTCLALAGRMNFAYKTVVTNGLQIATKIAGRDNITLIMPGGEIKSNTTALTGSFAINSLKNFRFDVALLSCAAVNKDGAYEFSLESSQIKQAVMQNSKINILLFDKTKMNTASHYHTALLHEYDMIFTNSTKKELELIHTHGCNFINE
ncbi:MAG: DeoR/GlpR transcriptional regulator [Clostridia bacterium]|nr:DeoR/GlpR transcriptional regulator [Clostridia bacterium]